MRLIRKIGSFWGQRRFEAELAEEIRIHREMAAEADAAGAFGSEAMAMEDSRAQWRFRWLDSLGQDIRYAIRGFCKAPLFAITVIGTIGMALGLNTTLFTVFNSYVLRPAAVRDPYSLYTVWWTSRSAHFGAPPSPAAFDALRKQNAAFADAAASSFLFVPVDGRFGLGHMVSDNYFRMLQPGASIGRLIEAGDDAVIVLSDSAWRNWFGGEPGVIGRKVLVRGQPVEVIGVTRPGFAGLGDVPIDFWVPLSMSPRVADAPPQLRITAKLKSNATEGTGKGSLWAWAAAATAQLPAEQRATGIHMVQAATAIHLTPALLAAFSPVFAAFGLVLAAACANISNMMLARALARQREMGIRVSLGAGRARLVRQLLTESVLLALPASAAGFFISVMTIRLAQRAFFATMPAVFTKFVRVPDLEADGRVFLFILAVSVGAAVLFGLIPALQTTRSNLLQANRGDFAADYRPVRLRNGLVAAQATVCCLLLIYSGVMLRSERRMSTLDVGMRTHGVFEVRTAPRYLAESANRLADQPGIEKVAGAWRGPLYNTLPPLRVRVSGSRDEVHAGYTLVTPEYFDVLRIPLLRGRIFSTEEARSGAAVVVISEATAKRLWPGRDALGERVDIVPRAGSDARPQTLPPFRSAQVIGIARDASNGYVADGLDPTCLYFPGTSSSGLLLVSVRGEKEAGRRLIEATMNSVAPGAADQINPEDEMLETTIYPFRVMFWIGGFLAGLALFLTVSGIYGVLSYVVNQRAKEIGIRMALGASGANVVGMVVGQSVRMAMMGTVLGAGFALMLAPLFAHQVQVLRPYDPVAYAAGAMLVIGAGLAAAMVPSRRAARIDPAVTLRCD